MDQLHQKLMERKGWYHFWHSQKGHQFAHWAVFLLVGTFFTVAIYARINNVGFLAQLRGMFGRASTTVSVNAGDNLQTAINNAQCGTILSLQAGQTWDTTIPYQLPNKGCTAGNPITVQSSRAGSLPAGRVSPVDAPNMARIRTSNGSGAFQSATNAGYWIFDGLEVTDNASGNTVVNFLFDFASFSGAHDMTVQRSYIHPKEIGTTNYTRNTIRGMEFEGSGLLFKWNHAAGFLGRQPDGQLPNTQVILCITCNNMTVTDNFLEAWYTALFTGGGGENPEYTATLSNASTSQANFSNVTGLSKGVIVRFNLEGSGTVNSNRSFTRSSGAALTSADVNHTIWITNSNGTERAKITAVNGNDYTLEPYNSVVPMTNGQPTAANFVVFETAEVTSVSGNTVSYTPNGLNRLTQSPTVPGSAAWRVNQVVHDINVTKNTFNIDVAHAIYERDNYPSHNSPKGWVEMKAGDNVLYEGNYFTGYPSTIAMTQHSNEGYTPWTNVQNVTIRSNYINSIYDTSGTRQWLIISLSDPYATDMLGCCVTVTNNLVKNVSSMAQVESITPATFTHNTVLNDHPSPVYGNYLLSTSSVNGNWNLSDNIMMNNSYGIQCYLGSTSNCWPQMTFRNNVIVDNNNNGNLASIYGAGELSPVVTSATQVGFTNLAGNDYRLSSSSPFKNKASDGTDPGVNWTTLVSALGFDPTGAAPPIDPGPTDTTPPTTSLTAPTSGVTLSGTTTVSASASDNVGVNRVEFLKDGSVFATDTSSPYSVSLDTITLTNASHTLQSKAYDSAGNSSPSSTVSITVSNQTSSPDQSISSLVLVNADSASPNYKAVIMNLPAGTTTNLNLATLPTRKLNIVATTNPSAVGSVVFNLDGSAFPAESVAPYAMAGDTSGNYNPWTPSLGSHTLIATPFSASSGSGTPGTAMTVNFNVTDQAVSSKSHLSLNPSSVSFGPITTEDPAPSPKSVALSNSGTASSSWTAASNQNWCHVSPASGSLASGGSVNLSVSVDEPSNVGTFSCSISISDSNADNSPQVIGVSYTVDPAPTPAATPSITSFSVSSKSATSATITWITNQATTGEVKCSTSKTSLSRCGADSISGTTHSVTLIGLSPKATYYYQITASNANGTTTSIISSFRTKPK